MCWKDTGYAMEKHHFDGLELGLGVGLLVVDENIFFRVVRGAPMKMSDGR